MTSALEPVVAFVAARTGMALSRQQRARVLEVAERLAPSGSGELLVAWLGTREGTEAVAELLRAVTVHKTDFFRDEGQLQVLEQAVFPRFAARPAAVWSAGCSTGEEVATLLLMLQRAGAHPDSTVLGTDVSREVLGQASALRFDEVALRRVPAPLRARAFVADGAHFRLEPRLAGQASFAQHNLVEVPYPLAPGGQGFDVIVCRNVLIYFTPEATEQVLTRFAQRLKPGGVLLLSAAEPILTPREDLVPVRYGPHFVYRRVDPEKPVPSAPRPVAQVAVVPPAPAPAPLPPPAPEGLSPEAEGMLAFSQALDDAASGAEESQTEVMLRRALYLAPQLAAARYVLGLILERRGEGADAASEYRRALKLLTEGQAVPAPFFLQAERLEVACRQRLDRLGRSR